MAEVTLDRDAWLKRTGPFYSGLLALCAVTALPLPRALDPSDDDQARSVVWFPAAGCAVGLALATLAWLVRAFHLVPGIAALVVTIAAWASSRNPTVIASDTLPRSQSSGRLALSASHPAASLALVGLVVTLGLRAGGLLGMRPETWWAALVVSRAGSLWAYAALTRASTPESAEARFATTEQARPGLLSWSALSVFGAIFVGVPAVLLGGRSGILALFVAACAVGLAALHHRRASQASSWPVAASVWACEILIILAFAAAEPAIHSPWTTPVALDTDSTGPSPGPM